MYSHLFTRESGVNHHMTSRKRWPCFQLLCGAEMAPDNVIRSFSISTVFPYRFVALLSPTLHLYINACSITLYYTSDKLASYLNCRQLSQLLGYPFNSQLLHKQTLSNYRIVANYKHMDLFLLLRYCMYKSYFKNYKVFLNNICAGFSYSVIHTHKMPMQLYM